MNNILFTNQNYLSSPQNSDFCPNDSNETILLEIIPTAQQLYEDHENVLKYLMSYKCQQQVSDYNQIQRVFLHLHSLVFLLMWIFFFFIFNSFFNPSLSLASMVPRHHDCHSYFSIINLIYVLEDFLRQTWACPYVDATLSSIL